MLEQFERITVETEEGEEIATIINDDEIDTPITVADGFVVQIKPKEFADKALIFYEPELQPDESTAVILEALEWLRNQRRKNLKHLPRYQSAMQEQSE